MAYKKQKGGPKMYREDGALPMKSPMKNINNMKEYSKSGDAVQFGDAPTDMKSSSFKMKSGSPMKRNFGIGASPVKAVSPMKFTGIRPVLPDGSYGDPISSTKAKEIIKNGGKIMKDGMNEVIANQAELEEVLADENTENYGNSGQNLQDQIDAAGDNTDKVLIQNDEGDVTETRFAPRTVKEQTTVGEGSDYQNEFVNLHGQELADADIEIQKYLDKHGSAEGMPEHLVEASKKLTANANAMRESTTKGESTNIKYEGDGLFDYGRIESKGNNVDKNQDYGFASGLQEELGFNDQELSADGVAQPSGTANAEYQTELDAIAEKERLAAEKIELEKQQKIKEEKEAAAKVTQQENLVKLDAWAKARGTDREKYYTYD